MYIYIIKSSIIYKIPYNVVDIKQLCAYVTHHCHVYKIWSQLVTILGASECGEGNCFVDNMGAHLLHHN